MKSSHFSLGLTIVLFSCAFIALEIFSFSTNDNTDENQNFQRQFNENYRIYSLNIPENLNFCQEKVPVFDTDVRERIDRELLVNTYWQSNSMLYHKRASKWFPVIEPILKQNGIPEDFKYLALIESGLMNVVSPAGATGFWQIMKKTATEFGLTVNSEVDERYHLEKSTEAACRYLNQAYKRYGNWTLTAASYNMGMNGLQRKLTKQNTDNYYDLLLNRETSRYVFRIIAVKEILEHPTKYGFHYRLKDLYFPVETYTVSLDYSVSDFSEFAKKNNSNYKILKIFNPWLRQSYLKNEAKKTYSIVFPKEGYFDLSSMITEPAKVDSIKVDSLTTDTIKIEKQLLPD